MKLSLLVGRSFPLGVDSHIAWKTSVFGEPDVVAGCSAVVKTTSQTQMTRKKLERDMIAIEKTRSTISWKSSLSYVRHVRRVTVSFFVRSWNSEACFLVRIEQQQRLRDIRIKQK